VGCRDEENRNEKFRTPGSSEEMLVDSIRRLIKLKVILL
jgi:hypothetical protein